MSITGSNVSNMLCEFNINTSVIVNGSGSNLMKIAYTGFNALPDELWGGYEEAAGILALDLSPLTHIRAIAFIIPL